jgi:predicted dehydrogenase
MGAQPAAGILIVGLGAVPESHVRALEHLPDAAVIAGVDTDHSRQLHFRGTDLPVYPSLREASKICRPDVVVIATPTPSHAAVWAEAAACLPHARLLIEKPAAADLADARHMLSGTGGHPPVDVAYHMAFSPEVTWGLEAVRARENRIGDLESAELFFADPYSGDFDHAAATLCSSWLDSGINALSVLTRFTSITGRKSLRSLGTERQSTFEGRLACQQGATAAEALIVTNWHVTDAAKTTRLRYTSGAELLMDHTAVTAYLCQGGSVEAFFSADRSVPRRERHYRALYQWWLIEGNPTFPPDTSRKLHELLLGLGRTGVTLGTFARAW